MAAPRMRRRWRSIAATIVTLILVGYVAWMEYASEPATHPRDVAEAESASSKKFRIAWLKPTELSAGSAVIIQMTGVDDSDPTPLTARIAKLPATVLNRAGDQIVVQVPRSLQPGPAKLRVYHGARRTKPRQLLVEPVARRKVLRNILGGLALFFFGLTLVGKALRAYAGQRIRTVLARLTQGSMRALFVGATAGGLTQSTTTTSGILVSLLDARMLAPRTAVTMVLGAQLGASAAGVLLPLAATREALLVIAVGVLWVAAADNRRTTALGNIILGCGMLFYGLRLLRLGFQPLVADPELLPYLHHLQANSPLGLLTCAAAGALLCGILQGPGPVFALVLSLAQSSGIIGVSDGLAILAGTSFGAAVGTTGVGWRLGKTGRDFYMSHGAYGLLVSGVGLIGLPIFVYLADMIAGGSPDTLAYGKKVLYPQVGLHLGVGFMLSQLAGLMVAIVVFRLRRRAEPTSIPPPSFASMAGAGGPDQALTVLEPCLISCKEALVAIDSMIRSRDRRTATEAEHHLEDAKRSLHAVLRLGQSHDDETNLSAITVTCMHLRRAIDTALTLGEAALEEDFSLKEEDARSSTEIHTLLLECMDALLAVVEGGSELSLDEAQSREIRINAMEAEVRRALVASMDRSHSANLYRLWFGEMAVAYEAIGNHLYRIQVALVADDDVL